MRLAASWISGRRAECQEAPGAAGRAAVLCAAPLGSSSTSEITRQGWKPAWRYRKCSPHPWPCVTSVPVVPEQVPSPTSAVSCPAQQRMEGCVQHPGPLLPPVGLSSLPRQVPDLGGRSQRRATDIINLQRFAAARLHLCRLQGTCSHAGKSDPSVA